MKASEEQWNRWIDGDLPADEAEAVAAMMAEDPESQDGDLAFFARLSGDLKATMPANRTPPFADFFNSQLQKRLWDLDYPDPEEKRSRWQMPSWLQLSWAAPLGAAAAVVIGLSQIGLFSDQAAAQGSQIVSAYTPDDTVQAETTFNADANAMVIRLKGIEPLPENFVLTPNKSNDEESFTGDVDSNGLVTLEETPSLELGTPVVTPDSF